MSLWELSLTENCPVEQRVAETHCAELGENHCYFAEDFSVLTLFNGRKTDVLEFPVGSIRVLALSAFLVFLMA